MPEQGPGLQAHTAARPEPPPGDASLAPVAPQPHAAQGPIALRFGPFELDLRTSELRRAGLLVKLQQQPARVLGLLAERRGELVLREDIRREVWGADTFVDFDQGLNFCIRQVRAALGDQAGQPRYVETLPRRGYRFLAQVERVYAPPPVAPQTQPPAAEPSAAPRRARPTLPVPAPVKPRPLSWRPVLLALAALVVLAVVAARWPHHGKSMHPSTNTARKAALVVLPLDNMTGDPEQDYLSDGLTEELITQLARLAPERLAVIARTSSMSYKGRRLDVRQVARELGVDYVLEGSLRRADGRVRVTAQLIQAADQTHLWAGAYDDDASDTIALQSDLTRRIVTTLAPHLVGAKPPDRPALAPFTPEPAAYDAYLRGRHLWGRRTPEALLRAGQLLERAITLDPGFAAAHTALARNWLSLAERDIRPALEAYPQARAAAQRALELDPDQAEAHLVLGVVKGYFEWDLPTGYAEFERAMRLEPGSAEARHALGDYYSALGQHDQAVASVRSAIALDPVSVAVRQDLGWYLHFARRHGEAAEAFRQALEFDSGDRDARVGLSLAYWYAGQRAEAVREAANVLRSLGALDEAQAAALLARAPGDAQRELLRLSRERASSVWGYMLPAMLGEREPALLALEAAADRHSRYLQVFVAGDPRLDFLRGDPRFEALARRIGLRGAPRGLDPPARPNPL